MPKSRKLPDPMLCLVFVMTPRGVIRARVIGDFSSRPFRKKKSGDYWTSWRRLSAAELELVVRED